MSECSPGRPRRQSGSVNSGPPSDDCHSQQRLCLPYKSQPEHKLRRTRRQRVSIEFIFNVFMLHFIADDVGYIVQEAYVGLHLRQMLREVI